MTTLEPEDPQPRDDVNVDEQGEPDDNVRELLAEPPADTEGGEAS